MSEREGETLSDEGIDEQPFSLSVGTRREVHGRLVRPLGYRKRGERLPHVIVVHGFKGFSRWGFFPELARRLAAEGLVAVMFDLSGSGVGRDGTDFTDDPRDIEAFARNTYSNELEDIEAVRAHLQSGALAGVDPERAGIFGHSRGGGMALVHAAELGTYRSLVTWSAIDDVDRFDAATKQSWRERGHLMIPNSRIGRPHRLELDVLDDVEANRSRLDILAACARLTIPVLVVHGTRDMTVDSRAADRIARALPEGLARQLNIDDAGHTFEARHPLSGVPANLKIALDATVRHLAQEL